MAKSSEEIASNYGTDNIQETFDALDHRARLTEVLNFLEAHDAPDFLIDTVEFAIADNNNWIDRDIEEAVASGRLTRPVSEN